MRTKAGFTLTELLVTIAIMGMMFGLLVPLVDRSLSGNRLANDAEVFRAKLEELRLMAGSTQHSDESSTSTHTGTVQYDEVGYYGIWLHSDSLGKLDGYDIVRLSYPVSATATEVPCKPADVQTQAFNESGQCFVERVKLSPGVRLSCKICDPARENSSNHFITYSVPAAQFFEIETVGSRWEETTFRSDPGENPDAPVIELTYNQKTATVTIDRYTGKASVTYR